MRCLILVIFACLQVAHAGWGDCAELVVADAENAPAGIRVTYLGVNGYQIEAAGHALLVDPYFTRVSLGAVAANAPLASDAALVDAAMGRLRRRVDAVLVTHAHFDHLLDVPRVMQRTGARLVAGPTAVNLAQACGVPAAQCRPVRPGAVRRIGPWTIRILPAAHDRLLGSQPSPGTVGAPAARPERAKDWVLGEPLAFVIEAAGRRIYVDSGGAPELLPEGVGRVDLAILGVALPDSRRRLAPTLRRLRPRYFLPSHQDDFFAPLDRGFTFGKLTDFPQVRRITAATPDAGRLILLDYFRPWTLR